MRDVRFRDERGRFVKQKGAPIFILNEERREALAAKLLEYEKRYNAFKAPESQQGTIFKTEVLRLLLEEGKVNTWWLSRRFHDFFRHEFDAYAFDNACAVISDYNLTGGKNVRGGTGLDATSKRSDDTMFPMRKA